MRAKFPFWDPDLPIDERVKDLLTRLTLEEKIDQMVNASHAIPRLGIPEYDWWNECLHGVGRAGIATVFPQAIGLAATFDDKLIGMVADVISTEARAKHHQALREGNTSRYTGLTFWAPNINIFRDPRWGRGQETYGEDPFLAAKMGVAFVRGLQGENPKYFKVIATPKHYAVHSGPENLRHVFNASVDERDLRQTYLPAFEATVKIGKAQSVMGAYNRTNGEACCASKRLLQEILRDEWGFEGYVVSDCGAIYDIFAHHKIVSSPEEAAALAVKMGCDLECGETYGALNLAVEKGLIKEEEIDKALVRLLTARFKLGMFDPVELVPFAQIPITENDTAESRALSLRAAAESIVLLKNDGILPLKKPIKIAVIGPNAHSHTILLGNYNGTPSNATSILQGILNEINNDNLVNYALGCDVCTDRREGFIEAIAIAQKSDVIIAVMGLDQSVEGEEGQSEGVIEGYRSQGDRVKIDLPGVQEELLIELKKAGKPIILVLLNGSALAINWAKENVNAILEAWYPGEEGGTAVAQVLFGKYNPAGRLPITFYRNIQDLPPFEDYRMQGRTYRYFSGEVLYPFGYGLSYSMFEYSDLQINTVDFSSTGIIHISVEVQNTGNFDGDEVVQCYVQDVDSNYPRPIWSLVGFERTWIPVGEKRIVQFTITKEQLYVYNDQGEAKFEPGKFNFAIGGTSPTTPGKMLTQPNLKHLDIEL